MTVHAGGATLPLRLSGSIPITARAKRRSTPRRCVLGDGAPWTGTLGRPNSSRYRPAKSSSLNSCGPRRLNAPQTNPAPRDRGTGDRLQTSPAVPLAVRASSPLLHCQQPFITVSITMDLQRADFSAGPLSLPDASRAARGEVDATRVEASAPGPRRTSCPPERFASSRQVAAGLIL
jgi:hypothetical protein